MKEEESGHITITTTSWVRGALVLFLAYAFFQVSHLLLVLIAAIVIASAVEPVTIWAKKRNIPRLLTVISVYLITALFLSIFFYFLLLPLIGEVTSFIKTLTIYSNAVVNDNVLSGMFTTQKVFGGLDTPAIMSELSNYLNSWSKFLSQGVFSSISSIVGGVMSFILIIVLSFYLSVQEEGITKFLKVITPLKHESYIVNLWKRTHIKIGRWMQGQLLLGALVMVLVYIGLLIIGVPHAFLLALLAGLFEIIPLVGPILAAIPAVFAAYGALGTTTALVVIGLYVIIQQFENHLIYPMVVKKVIGVPPMVSILALVIGGQLAGFLGIIIAVPVAVVVLELLSDLEEQKMAKISQMESASHNAG